MPSLESLGEKAKMRGEREGKTKRVSEIGRERERGRGRGKVAEGCGDEEMEGRPIRGREDLSADDGCARMGRRRRRRVSSLPSLYYSLVGQPPPPSLLQDNDAVQLVSSTRGFRLPGGLIGVVINFSFGQFSKGMSINRKIILVKIANFSPPVV